MKVVRETNQQWKALLSKSCDPGTINWYILYNYAHVHTFKSGSNKATLWWSYSAEKLLHHSKFE